MPSGEFYVILITNFASQMQERSKWLSTNSWRSGMQEVQTVAIIAGDLGPDQEVCEGETRDI